jgi:Tfp pilus assembly protein PilO
MKDAAYKGHDYRRQLWVYAVAVLFCADFVFYGYLPSHKRLLSLQQMQVQQERMIQASAAQSEELPALKTRLKDVEQIAGHYEAYVPSEASLGSFLQEIARIMTEHHLTDQVVVPGKETQCAPICCILVRVNCKGSLKDVFGFFRDFQAMDRLVRVEKVVLQNGSDFQGQVSMEAETVIFYGSRAEPASANVAGDTREAANHGV